jgi:hypothetical protein
MERRTSLGSLEEFKTRALEHIRSDDLRTLLDPLFTRFHHGAAMDVIARTNRFPAGDLHYMREKGAIGVAVFAAALLHHFGEVAALGDLSCEYELWGNRDAYALRGERIFDIFFLMPTADSKHRNVTFNIEIKNYAKAGVGTLRDLNKQILYDTKRLNPPGALQPLIPVWTFMQGLHDDARAELEARAFGVIDFTRPHLLTEMRRAFRVPSFLRAGA